MSDVISFVLQTTGGGLAFVIVVFILLLILLWILLPFAVFGIDRDLTKRHEVYKDNFDHILQQLEQLNRNQAATTEALQALNNNFIKVANTYYKTLKR